MPRDVRFGGHPGPVAERVAALNARYRHHSATAVLSGSGGLTVAPRMVSREGAGPVPKASHSNGTPSARAILPMVSVRPVEPRTKKVRE